MRLRGYTDPDDWNVRTLFDMVWRPGCWNGGIDWKDWRWSALYTWYDGPIWQVHVGPAWIAIGPWN